MRASKSVRFCLNHFCREVHEGCLTKYHCVRPVVGCVFQKHNHFINKSSLNACPFANFMNSAAMSNHVIKSPLYECFNFYEWVKQKTKKQ